MSTRALDSYLPANNHDGRAAREFSHERVKTSLLPSTFPERVGSTATLFQSPTGPHQIHGKTLPHKRFNINPKKLTASNPNKLKRKIAMWTTALSIAALLAFGTYYALTRFGSTPNAVQTMGGLSAALMTVLGIMGLYATRDQSSKKHLPQKL